AVQADRVGPVQLARGGGTTIAAVAGRAHAGDGNDVAAVVLLHFADGGVERVRDEDVPIGIDGHAFGVIQLGRRGRSAVAAVAGRAGAGDGEDVAGRLHDLADAIIAGVGDVDVAAAVHGHAVRAIQHGGRGGAAVATAAGRAGAGDGEDGAGGLHDFANAVRGGVGDEEIAAGIDRHALRRSNPGRGGRSAVAAVGRGAVARDGDDDAGRLDDLADAVVIA